MPELPEVESVKINLEKHILHQKIISVTVYQRKLRWPIPDNLEEILQGLTVRALKRRAKYLLIYFKETEFVLLWHLGMSGRIQIFDPQNVGARQKHDHVEIKFHSGLTLRFHDPRRFGAVLLIPQKDLLESFLLKTLGVEPFDENFSSSVLLKLFAKRSLTMKAILLNQKIIAGLGNIYVCEVLHQARLSPLRIAKTLNSSEMQALVEAIQDVLRRAIAAGGSTLKDHRQPNGEKGSFQNIFKVYGREKEKCFQCNKSVIKRIVQSNRSTFYCMGCQT